MKKLNRSKVKFVHKKDYSKGIIHEIANRYYTTNNPLYGLGPEYRRLRLKRGILQQKIAEDGTISLSKYCKFELGQVTLNFKEMKHIMKKFELKESDLYTPYKIRKYMKAMMMYYLRDNHKEAHRLYELLKHRDQNAIILVRFIYATMTNDVENARSLFTVLEGIRKAFEDYEFKVYTIFAALYFHRINANGQALALLEETKKLIATHVSYERLIVTKIRYRIALKRLNLPLVVNYHHLLNQAYIKRGYHEAKQMADKEVLHVLSFFYTKPNIEEWILDEAVNSVDVSNGFLRSYLREQSALYRSSVVRRCYPLVTDPKIAFVFLEIAELNKELLFHPEWLEKCDEADVDSENRPYLAYWKSRVNEDSEVLQERLRNKLLLEAEMNEDPRLLSYYASEYGRLLTEEGKYKEAYRVMEHIQELKTQWNCCF